MIIRLLFILLLIYLFPKTVFSQEKMSGHGGPVKGLTISPDGLKLVSTSFDYSSLIWSLEDMSQLNSLTDHNAAVNKAKFSPDQKKLITISDDMRVLVYNFENLSNHSIENLEYFELGSHQGKVSDVKFSFDGELLATSGWDGQIMIWDMIKEKLIYKTSAGHRGSINAIQFSKDKKYIYSAGSDGTIRKLDIFKQESDGIMVSKGWGVNVFHIDEERSLLTFGTTDGAFIIYDIENDIEKLKLGDERSPVLSLTTNNKGSIIALGNSEGRVVIIDLENLSLVRDFRAAYGPVWALALNSDASMLFAGGLDDYINQWDLVTYPQPVIVPPGPARRFNPGANTENGEKQFARKCSVCHTLIADGKNRAGPTLYKIFGRKAGTLEGYKYSKALLDSEIVWDEKTIHRLFTEGPDVVLPGTKMPIQRMKNSKDRVDLVNFLKISTE